jgi:uncharacterized membrane protein YphA (DoxX/SURF4 family)
LTFVSDRERRSPLAAPRRTYPGFFGALFLVLLRLAIGWHFLYEGTQKILSTPQGKASILARIFPETPDGPPFSSEGYLRNASGPLAPRFRALIPDVDGRDRLDLGKLKDEWSAEMYRIANHYGFDADQQQAAEKILKDRQQVADDWYQSPESHEKVKQYLDALDEVEAVERNPNALAYEVENARADRKGLAADRKSLIDEVDAWSGTLRDGLLKLARPGQTKKFGDYAPPPSPLQRIDLVTMWGLSAVGLCLMLGLFTPLAALGGAAYLLSFYLSMPPWPGLPEGITEGHYRYVNKNLIEMLACLALASTPSGLWIGVDALLFGWIGRKRRAREAAQDPTSRAPRPEPQDRREFNSR